MANRTVKAAKKESMAKIEARRKRWRSWYHANKARVAANYKRRKTRGTVAPMNNIVDADVATEATMEIVLPRGQMKELEGLSTMSGVPIGVCAAVLLTIGVVSAKRSAETAAAQRLEKQLAKEGVTVLPRPAGARSKSGTPRR